jgi:hypothetical protein
MYTGNNVTVGDWAKNTTLMRCFWPQAEQQVIVLSSELLVRHFEKGSIDIFLLFL